MTSKLGDSHFYHLVSSLIPTFLGEASETYPAECLRGSPAAGAHRPQDNHPRNAHATQAFPLPSPTLPAPSFYFSEASAPNRLFFKSRPIYVP